MTSRPVVVKQRKNMLSPPPDRPCPTCYAVMKLIDGWFTCPNHGPVMRPEKR